MKWILMMALAMAEAFGVAAWAEKDIPEGWRVTVSSSIIAPKAGVYAVTVYVRDNAGQPVSDARVLLRIPDSPDPGKRLVPARHIGKGRYWTTAMAQRDWQRPLRVTAIVTPNPLAGGRLSLGMSATARATVPVWGTTRLREAGPWALSLTPKNLYRTAAVSVSGSDSPVTGNRDVVPFQTPGSLHYRPLLTIVLPRGGREVRARTIVGFAPHESLPGATAGPRSIVSGRSPRSAAGETGR